jgi:hypothetical protein
MPKCPASNIAHLKCSQNWLGESHIKAQRDNSHFRQYVYSKLQELKNTNTVLVFYFYQVEEILKLFKQENHYLEYHWDSIEQSYVMTKKRGTL